MGRRFILFYYVLICHETIKTLAFYSEKTDVGNIKKSNEIEVIWMGEMLVNIGDIWWKNFRFGSVSKILAPPTLYSRVASIKMTMIHNKAQG